MSFVVTAPEFVVNAAGDLAHIGSAISAANGAAAAPTTAVVAAAGDEVSAAIASLFSSHAHEFQALNAQAAAFHAEFVQALSGAAGTYAAAEAANASPIDERAGGYQFAHPAVVRASADRQRRQRGGGFRGCRRGRRIFAG